MGFADDDYLWSYDNGKIDDKVPLLRTTIPDKHRKMDRLAKEADKKNLTFTIPQMDVDVMVMLFILNVILIVISLLNFSSVQAIKRANINKPPAQ